MLTLDTKSKKNLIFSGSLSLFLFLNLLISKVMVLSLYLMLNFRSLFDKSRTLVSRSLKERYSKITLLTRWLGVLSLGFVIELIYSTFSYTAILLSFLN